MRSRVAPRGEADGSAGPVQEVRKLREGGWEGGHGGFGGCGGAAGLGMDAAGLQEERHRRARTDAVRPGKRTLRGVSSQDLIRVLQGIECAGLGSWRLRICHSATLRGRMAAVPVLGPALSILSGAEGREGTEAEKCSQFRKLMKVETLGCGHKGRKG